MKIKKKNLQPIVVESTVVNRIIYLTNNTILNLIFLRKSAQIEAHSIFFSRHILHDNTLKFRI